MGLAPIGVQHRRARRFVDQEREIPRMVRVLVVHNRYQSGQPSGENAVVDSELALLQAAPDVDVLSYQRSSDEIESFGLLARATLPARPLWSPADLRRLRATIRQHRTEIVHLHNPYPLLSPGVVRVAHAAGVPVVQTVHNHRLGCMSGVLTREGKSCTACVGKRVPLPGVLHGCYRGSRVQSLAMAATLTAHHGTWRQVDRFLVLTPTLGEFLRSCGIPPERITVKPNGLQDPGSGQPGEGSGFAFAGRLMEEKGIRLLLDSWDRQPSGRLGTLHIVGDGPLRPLVDAAAARRSDIHVHGMLSGAQTADVLAAARVVVVPSTWPEPFSLVAVEALAHSRPVLATQVGGLPHVVPADAGWLVPPTVDGLAAGLRTAAEQDVSTAGRNARTAFLERYRDDVVIRQLVGIYSDVISRATAG
jgi:glycosyltransferase involved in cell wall biosynthesis